MNIIRTFLLVVTVGLSLLAASCGGGARDSLPEDARVRTVSIRMVDVSFTPSSLHVRAGETVRFRFENTGKLVHDAFIGEAEAQARHGAEMRDGDGHDHGDDSEAAVTVAPGRIEELVYTFAKAGLIEIGCHQPGHYEGGMKVTVAVT